MLSIGEFSRVTGLTVKTVRLYDERGILPPAVVSDDSGYRYYNAACVERARVIKQLRELDFSLAAIAEILATGKDEADILSFLERQRSSGGPSADTLPESPSGSATTASTRRKMPISSRASPWTSPSRQTASPFTRWRGAVASR